MVCTVFVQLPAMVKREKRGFLMKFKLKSVVKIES